MPHGESWLTLLFERYLAPLAHAMGAPFNDAGLTWMGHAPVRFAALLSFLLVIVILAFLATKSKARLSNVQQAIVPSTKLDGANIVEVVTEYTYGNMVDIMGKDAAKVFLPLIGTCAFIILTSNLLGLVPGMVPATDTFQVTFAMGVIIFFATHIYGFKAHGIAYLKHFLGPVWWLAWLMGPIELISHFSRPITLGVRLAINMVADHAVLSIFLGLALGAFALPFYFLGLLVSVVQTMVFCLLSTVYISMSIAHEEH